MKVSKEFLKPVLEKLYSVYPSFIDLEGLKKEVMKKTTHEEVKGVCLYLADQGLVVEGPSTPYPRRWRISALGIDFLEPRPLLKLEPAKPVKPDIFLIDKEK